MKELLEYAREVVKSRPELVDEVNGLLSLCYSEIEEGGSPTHEIELCADSIKQLIE
jgi:hypothetical protein